MCCCLVWQLVFIIHRLPGSENSKIHLVLVMHQNLLSVLPLDIGDVIVSTYNAQSGHCISHFIAKITEAKRTKRTCSQSV